MRPWVRGLCTNTPGVGKRQPSGLALCRSLSSPAPRLTRRGGTKGDGSLAAPPLPAGRTRVLPLAEVAGRERSQGEPTPRCPRPAVGAACARAGAGRTQGRRQDAGMQAARSHGISRPCLSFTLASKPFHVHYY